MRIPRDIDGEKLARLLSKYDYELTRQTGSHIRLTTSRNGEHHLTVPKHKQLKVGTLNAISSPGAPAPQGVDKVRRAPRQTT
ncbi:MAG: type II toxin-antitoxin system HicA family toxin [Actinobacteria bacterium]|nr:type II toxin-antitoxin system HicA family toxin [Actinomycetota bacterium]MBU4178383.1 type II toxin-antitoxin system HicA family toxin [Actinomycetota bacterium]MBU4218489.1 type II toxin-antitoxin system HicA family toxin [Actinomycetota bacterium]MBU4360140.1 type II toxin-antitoxin system HicA family toxin [Actinomycetota bacterium]MBU4401759.1 type II toxin-antitoxin system HicA family toxin [Actinomycetota bacterium]